MQPQYSVVAFSHLRWNFVYQRPQHLLSRLAATRPVFFIEEPEFDPTGPVRWERGTPCANVVVLRPRTPIQASGFSPEQLTALEPLIKKLASELQDSCLVAWLYTPLALPLAEAIGPELMVYDCMDELSLLLGAPPELLDPGGGIAGVRGRDVHRRAPVCTAPNRPATPTCTASPAVWTPPTFGTAREGRPERVLEAADQAALPHPRLGFYRRPRRAVGPARSLA